MVGGWGMGHQEQKCFLFALNKLLKYSSVAESFLSKCILSISYFSLADACSVMSAISQFISSFEHLYIEQSSTTADTKQHLNSVKVISDAVISNFYDLLSL
jgi:hypothetical protein